MIIAFIVINNKHEVFVHFCKCFSSVSHSEAEVLHIVRYDVGAVKRDMVPRGSNRVNIFYFESN